MATTELQKDVVKIPTSRKQLENYTIEEIDALAKAAKKVIEQRQKKNRTKDLNDIALLVIKNQFSLEDVVLALKEKNAIFDKNYQNGQPQRVYQNPNDETDIWGGAGRQPDWLREEIAMGADINDFMMFKDIRDEMEQLNTVEKIISRCEGKKGSTTVVELGENSVNNANLLFEMAAEDSKIIETKVKDDERKQRRRKTATTKTKQPAVAKSNTTNTPKKTTRTPTKKLVTV